MTETRYLVSNFREMLSILEGLRISPEPGKGMEYLSPRPCISGALRTGEADLITNGKSGEFPVLIEVEAGAVSGGRTSQGAAIPLGKVTRVIFRSGKDRDVAINRTFENASFAALSLEVDPDLFGADGEPRFSKAKKTDPLPGEGWLRSDWLCGGLAALLAAASRHPEVSETSATEFLDSAEGKALISALERQSSATGPLDLLVDLLARNSGSGDLYGEDLLDQTVSALERSSLDRAVLEKFAQWMRGILAADITRKRGELKDDGDIVLRAISIVIQRSSVIDVLEERIGDDFPGPMVFMTAALLSGVREGLACLPWTLKSDAMDLLGTIAALVENEPGIDAPVSAAMKAMSGQTSKSGLPEEAEVASEPVDDHVGHSELRLEICSWKSKAIIERALTDLAQRPPSWRIVCDDAQVLHLHVVLDGMIDANAIEAEAGAAIRTWSRKAPARKRSRSPKAKDATPVDTFPGLLEPGKE